jgi:hypothetical protein
VQYISNEENIDNRNTLLLSYEPNQSTPIIAASYRRDLRNGTIEYYKKINHVYRFSGIWENSIEKDTVSDLGKIYWDNIDTNKKEFILDFSKRNQISLLFNKDYTKTFGVIPDVYNDLGACKIIGTSNGANYQIFYLEHFPIIPNDFKLYIADSSSWEEWTRAETWFDLINTDSYANRKKYYLDKDLGIIYFGDKLNRPDIGKYIVCKYTVGLRIEYEEQDKKLNIIGYNANTNPINQHINQGFICITHEKIEPASITLSINKKVIPFTYNPKAYGPITIGSDYAILKANVRSYSDIPVPDIEVEFKMTPNNLGYLDEASNSFGITNSNGDAYTSYQPPTSAEDLGYYITNTTSSEKIRTSTHPSYTSHKDVIISNKNADLIGRENNIYTYQILKDDLLLGYDNVSDWIDSNMTIPAWVYNDDSDIQDANIEKWKSEVILKYNLKDWLEENGPSGIKSDGSISGRKVICYKTVAQTYKTTEPKGIIDNGTDNYDSNAINPVTGESGAIVPIRPVLVEKITDESDEFYGYIRLIFPEDAIIDPDPTDSNVNVAGYWIVCTKNIEFQAKCWSSRYNRYIYSNKIIATITLPEYLLGEHIINNINKIPYGWRLLSDDSNVAAGLNGATFLTINPTSGPYEIIDLTTGVAIGTDIWATAPTRSISFLVTPSNPVLPSS